MQKTEAAMILAGVKPEEQRQASAPTNLHVITGTVTGKSDSGKTRVSIDGLVFTSDNSQYIEIDTLGGLEEGDMATILLTGEAGHGMTPLAVGAAGSIDRIDVRIGKIEADYVKATVLEANYATITNLDAATARIHDLEVDHVTIDDFEAEQAKIGALQTATADIDTIRANSAKVQNLTAAELEADHATVGSLSTTYATISNLNAANGRIDNLESSKANVTDLTAATGRITSLEAADVSITGRLDAAEAVIDDLDANYIHTDMLNADVAWLQNGVIKDGAIVNGMIQSVSANKLTAGTIDASDITVTNLNADNITTGTINGQRIGTGSLSLDKLEEDVYTETEVNNIVDGLQTQIDGAIETWTGTAVPTLQNAPAVNWNTNAKKDSHVGDVYFVVNSNSQQNGYNYRFTKSGNTYSWQLIKDSDVTNALARLSTAEGKITTFDSDISTLKTDTGTLKTKTTSLETRMSDAESDILDKVDTTTFNEVSDTVDGHTQSITQMSQTLSNKADGSTVTALTTRVNKTEQDISGINTTIGSLQTTVESKADGSTVETISSNLNTISDTVDGHTQSITSINNTLTTKADSSTVSSLQQDYANFKQTTQQFESTVGQTYATKTELQTTDDKIENLEIGGRNLVLNTAEPKTATSDSGSAYVTNWTLSDYGHALMNNSDDIWTISFDYEVTGNESSEAYIYPQCRGSQIPSSIEQITLFVIDAPVGRYSKRFKMNATQASGSSKYIRARLRYATDGATLTVTNLKLEKGNKATDWTPAPEDLESSVTSIEQRVSTAETSITQNTTNIALKANSSDVYTKTQTDGLISTEVTNRNSAIEQSAEAISLSVSQTYVTKTTFNNLEVGGRNLLRKTGHFVSADIAKVRSTVLDDGTIRLTPTASAAYSKVIVDYLDFAEYGSGTYTVSCEVKAADVETSYTDTKLNIYLGFSAVGRFTSTFNASYDGYKSYTVLQETPTDWTKVSYTWVVPDNLTAGNASALVAGSQLAVQVYQNGGMVPLDVRRLKLEKGNKATDWSPAPEDLEAYADAAIVAIRNDVNSVISRVSTAETSITQNTTDIALKANASDVYTIAQTDGLISTEVSNRNSAIEQSASAINLSVSQTYSTKTELAAVNARIEGRNLLLGTSVPVNRQIKAELIYDVSELVRSMSVGDPIVISFDIQSTQTQWMDLYFANGTVYSSTSDFYPFFYIENPDTWYHVVYAGTIGSNVANYNHLRFRSNTGKHGGSTNLGVIQIKNMKLEVGETPTNWTPAPEDLSNIESRVSTAETTISNNSEEILLRALKTEVYTTEDTDNLISSVQNGGRNLLFGTEEQYVLTENADAFYVLSKDANLLAQDDDITLSFYAKASVTKWIDFYWRNNTTSYNNESSFYPAFQLTTDWEHYTYTGPAGSPAALATSLRIRKNSSEHGGASTGAGATVYIRNAKLEKGSVATDLATTTDFLAATAEIKVTTDGISSAVSQKVGNNEIISKINQSAETVKIQASKVEIDGTAVFTSISSSVDNAITSKGYATTGQVATAKNEAITAAATDATNKANAVQTNLDNLEIGGRNLLPSSIFTSVGIAGSTKELGPVALATMNSNFAANNKYIYNDFEPNTTYIFRVGALAINPAAQDSSKSGPSFTFRYSDDTSNSIRFYYGQEDVVYQTLTSDPTKTLVRLTSSYSNAGTQWTFYNMKLEKGNKATDWTPAPEDTDSAISSVEDSIPTKVSDLTNDSNFQTDSQVETTITGKGYQTSAQVETTITGKGYQTSAQVESAITGKGYQTSAQVESAITDKGYQTSAQVESAITGKGYQTSAQVESAITSKGYATTTYVDSIEIGGRNLLRYDVKKVGWGSNAVYISENVRGMYCQVEEGKTYTISRSFVEGNRFGIYSVESEPITHGLPATQLHSGTATSDLVVTVTIPAGGNWLLLYLSNEREEISDGNIKVERGNKATDWTPAPEDQAAYTLASGMEYIEGTQEAATNLWTGVSKESALVAGKSIAYKLPFAGNSSAATLELTLADGTTTGAKEIKMVYSTSSNTAALANITTHYPVGSIIQMTYDGTLWVVSNYNTNVNYYDRVNHANALYSASAKATGKSYAIVSSSVIGYIESLTGYQTILAGSVVDISKPILWGGGNVAANKTFTNSYEMVGSATLRNNYANWAGTTYSTVYLFGTLSGNSLTVGSTVFTDTIPTTEDGNVYIPVGILYSTYQIAFRSSSDIYAFIDGEFRLATPSTIVGTHRVYYRTATADSTLAAPSTWVAEATGNVYDAWSTKVPPLATSTDEGQTKYLYLYTCEQRKRLDGRIECTKVLLDENTTVIDGGQIITNSVTANQIAAGTVTAEEIAGGTITSDQIAAGAISADRLEANALTLGNIDGLEDRLAEIDAGLSTLSNSTQWVNFQENVGTVFGEEGSANNVTVKADGVYFNTEGGEAARASAGIFYSNEVQANDSISAPIVKIGNWALIQSGTTFSIEYLG